MRIAVLFLLALVAAPSRSLASGIVSMEFLNSDLTFGRISPDHRGFDLHSFYVPGYDGNAAWDGDYSVLGATFVDQTITRDALGNALTSLYTYSGGEFVAHITARISGKPLVSGSFRAPLTSFTISVSETPPDREVRSVQVFYEFGRGAFDEAFARALGIPAGIRGGNAYGDLGLTDNGNRDGIGGDETTVSREAWDGVLAAEFTVPEPSLTLLALVSVAAAGYRRRLTARSR